MTTGPTNFRDEFMTRLIGFLPDGYSLYVIPRHPTVLYIASERESRHLFILLRIFENALKDKMFKRQLDLCWPIYCEALCLFLRVGAH
jgi:hypothetical protein